MRQLTIVATAGMALAALAGCGQSTSSTSGTAAKTSDCGSGMAGSSLVKTAHYELMAAAGPLETTYTRAQVASQHPSSGEMMVSGDMVGDPGMSMGGDAGSGMGSPGPTSTGMAAPGGASSGSYRHVEVHICDRTSGRVVQNVTPTMFLVDRSAAGMRQQLPAAAMQGVRSGVADLHYGNNAQMIMSHDYALEVTMMGERATLDLGTAH
jgi:hypothetical protein